MKVQLPPLPYDAGALKGMSARSMTIHHEEHQGGYVRQLNKLESIVRLPEKTSLEAVILKGASMYEAALNSKNEQNLKEKVLSVPERLGVQVPEFNLASQVYSHSIFWRSMHPEGGGVPEGVISQRLMSSFGGYAPFCQMWKDAAMSLFGSGWVWLALLGTDLYIVRGFNAGNPIVYGMVPLLVMDVWEHAYYLDYQSSREEYVDNFLENLINWSFANENMMSHIKG